VSLAVAQLNRGRNFELWASMLARANVAASASAALIWLAARRGFRATPPGPLLALQALLALGASALLLLVPLSVLVLEPGTPLPVWLQPESPASGWPALMLATLAAFWYRQDSAPERRLHVVGVGCLLAGVLLARTVAPWDTGDWLSYHVLTAAWAGVGLAAAAVGSIAFSLRLAGLADGRREDRAGWLVGFAYTDGVRRWVEISCALVVALAFRGGWGDPYRPYASTAALLLVSVMLAALAIWFRLTRYVWASGLVFNLAGVVIWLALGHSVEGLLLTNAIGLAAAAGFWTAVALVLPGAGPTQRRMQFSHAGAAIALTLLTAIVGQDWLTKLTGSGLVDAGVLAWPAIVVTGLALVAALWDSSARWAVAGLYLLGLDIVVLALVRCGLEGAALFRASTVGLAIYLSLAAVCHTGISPRFLESLWLPSRDGRWFVAVQQSLALAVFACGADISIAYLDPGSRMMGPLAAALAVPAVALVGPQTRRLTLVLAAAVLAEVALAVPDPAGAAPWLHRTAFLLAAFVAAGFVYSDVLPSVARRWPEWATVSRSVGDGLAGLALVTIVPLLAQEIRLFDVHTGRTPMEALATWLVPAAIVALAWDLVRRALVNERDPFQLPPVGKTLYVYGAEVLLLLVIIHLRLTVPELFGGWIGRHWTLVVMLLGFVAMGAAELFDRRRSSVLAEPLRRTGLVLPVVPLAAYWIKIPLLPAGAFPQDLAQYAVLWLIVALLYGLAASLWRSPLLALLSAFALNFGFWCLLANGGVAFLEHPQLWLIPPALIVLVAEHLNRERLPAEAAASLRYLGICTIYVSSTADHFIAGLGNSVVLPVVLAVLAVTGVLAGIALRVRAFLFLGVSFLLLDVLTMIWHAAVNLYHTWVWWASGIVLGVAILALFAVFEKRRKDVLQLIDEIKAWH
jgi:hypothetical protein